MTSSHIRPFSIFVSMAVGNNDSLLWVIVWELSAVSTQKSVTWFVFDYWTRYLLFCSAPLQPGASDSTGQGRDKVPAGPYPGSHTTGASLTNCPCLATWETGDCGNCIFSSNCICHMWGLQLTPFSLMCYTKQRNSHLHPAKGMCKKGPAKRAINYVVAQNISRALSGNESSRRRDVLHVHYSLTPPQQVFGHHSTAWSDVASC